MSMKPTFTSLQNHFLVAMPVLQDQNFAHAVIYICVHNEEGAMGITINRPMLDLNMGEIMQQMNITITAESLRQTPVLLGGPVQPERGFLIHRPGTKWQSTLAVTDDIAVTSSQDILQALADGKGPEEFLMVLGFSGWSEGQLEQELANNAWLTVPADPKVLFDLPFNERWEAAGSLLGIQMGDLSDEVGHA